MTLFAGLDPGNQTGAHHTQPVCILWKLEPNCENIQIQYQQVTIGPRLLQALITTEEHTKSHKLWASSEQTNLVDTIGRTRFSASRTLVTL